MNNAISVKKGQVLPLQIESIAFGGKGVARVGDFVIFVQGGLPGQTVNARIVKKRKSYADAKTVEIVEPSPNQVEPRCEHFGVCGGCLLQHYDYQAQVTAKGRQVGELLERLGGLSDFELLPAIPAPDPYEYRNKIEFSIGRKRWLSPEEIASQETIEMEPLYAGFHARGFFDKIVDIERCHLMPPVASDILAEVRRIARESGLPAYDTSDHQGYWRFLIIRPAANTDDLMVNIVTRDYLPEMVGKLKTLSTMFPQITSLINGLTASKSSVAFCEDEVILAGEPVIREKLGGYEFEISANSFFQTNTRQAEHLYAIALEYANLTGKENVYDLYCGAGSISLYVSSRAGRVTGFESVSSAVQDAKQNAEHNHVDNCEFVLADLKDAIRDTETIVSNYGQPDVIILDPPRGGMHPKTVEAVVRLQPQRIVHVSCNPSTLARELAEMCSNGYKLVKVQPVDMFPHTAHVEVVAQLEKVL